VAAGRRATDVGVPDQARAPATRSCPRVKEKALKPFEEIVTEHGPAVLRVCRAVLGPEDAEDAWSETFLAALKAYPGLDEGANVEAWLVTIAHRKAIDAIRAGARRPVAVAGVPDRPSGSGRPEAWDGDLWEALRELPDKQRFAVAYHYLAGLPYREIAEITGGSTDAARRAAADGIKHLRETYATKEAG
jgi:RNA polymerase sigma factor (sigma-70 family)